MFFRNKQPPTRSELVLAADQARAKGRLRKAVAAMKGRPLKEVRWAQWCIAPGPGATWRWLRAAVLGR